MFFTETVAYGRMRLKKRNRPTPRAGAEPGGQPRANADRLLHAIRRPEDDPVIFDTYKSAADHIHDPDRFVLRLVIGCDDLSFSDNGSPLTEDPDRYHAVLPFA